MNSDTEKDKEKLLNLDNADFVVSRENYEQFLAALNEPPKSIPALKELFHDEKYQRQIFLEGLNEDFKNLKQDAEAWREELEERAIWNDIK